MIYVIFAVLLVVSNLLTFRFTAKYITNLITKELDDLAEERKRDRTSGNYISKYRPRPSKVNAVEEYIIEDRHDAEHVLTMLKECADKYGHVSVADYHDLIKVASSFAHNAYGWGLDSISEAMIVPVRGGYVIKFQPVQVL